MCRSKEAFVGQATKIPALRDMAGIHCLELLQLGLSNKDHGKIQGTRSELPALAKLPRAPCSSLDLELTISTPV